MSLISINPATGKEIESFKPDSEKHVQSILKSSIISQKIWKETGLDFRLSCLEQLSACLLDKKLEYAKLMTEEMGKPIIQSELEVEKCALLCNYYLEKSSEILKDKKVEILGQKSFIAIEPIGLILGIMPWNFPFWQVFRFAVPTLMVGNGALLKHASNVQRCARAIEECFIEAGFPDNIFRNLKVPGNKVDNIIIDPAINGITITGSTPAGRSVAKIAGSVLKKTVLELGGSDPYIIFEDANLENAIDCCINGRMLNAGQSCIAAKRLIVVESVYDDFVKKLEQKLSKKIMGNPLDEVDIGPMVSINARNEVHQQVINSINKGAKLVLGGIIPDGEGAYYPITILKDVRPGITAFDDEIFGPVFSVVKAENESNAIELANKTQFGLGAAIFTHDIQKGEDIARSELNAGACFVNDFVKSDPRLPFGGVKDSGYGRELSSYGMLEFANVKTIVVKES